LEKTIQHHHEDEGFSKADDDFAFFDDPEVYMDEEKLVVVRKKPEDDSLRKIMEKEFSPKFPQDEPTKAIQKPPRKSLEYRKSMERSSYSSHSSSHYCD
jgi:hypothetical protein